MGNCSKGTGKCGVDDAATVCDHGMVYKVVAQSVLLYVSESWVVTGEMLKVLEGFCHQATRKITGMMVTRDVGRDWEYPPVLASLESAGLHPTMQYIRRWQSNIAEKVSCRPIYELSVEAERRPGMSRSMIWWDQDLVNEPEE